MNGARRPAPGPGGPGATGSWFSKSLGDPLIAGEALSRLEGLVHTARRKAGELPELALFVRQESDGRLHCEMRAYFSPAAATIARAEGAAMCERPLSGGLSLLVGTLESWRALFPDRPA